MRHDMRGRGTIALPQRGFALFVQGGSLMVLTLEFLATIVATVVAPGVSLGNRMKSSNKPQEGRHKISLGFIQY